MIEINTLRLNTIFKSQYLPKEKEHSIGTLHRFFYIKKGIAISSNPFLIKVLEAGLEPARPQWPQDFKSCVSTNSTTRALIVS